MPATAFSEPDRNTSKPVVFRWFARPGREPFYFAGIWREWKGDRGTKEAPNVGKHLLFSFLTTEPNGGVQPLHDKATAVLIRTKDEVEQWSRRPRRPCSCKGGAERCDHAAAGRDGGCLGKAPSGNASLKAVVFRIQSVTIALHFLHHW